MLNVNNISLLDYYNATMVPRASTMPTTIQPTQNPSQQTVPIQMVNNTQSQNFPKAATNKRRPNAIKIIDPDTGRCRILFLLFFF